MTRTARLEVDGAPTWCLLEDDIAFRVQGPVHDSPRRGDRLGPVEGFRILRPMDEQNTLVCLLGNWRNRDDRDGPSFFVKPSSSLIDPGQPIVYPEICTQVVYEPELAVVMGRTCRGVGEAAALDHVRGYTCVNDVTALGMGVTTNLAALPGKSFDTFGSIGPWVESDVDPGALRLTAAVNGEILTDRSTADMLWNAAQVVSWVSRFMTLRPGDVIALGTPPEHYDIRPGDDVAVGVAGIGELRNPVVAAR